MDFVQWASMIAGTYGATFDSYEGWVGCPECGEPIYKEDCPTSATNDWECPCCGFTGNE